MQRLYSEFPAGHPGFGLLLLRLLTCGMVIRLEGASVTAMVAESHTLAAFLPWGLLIAAGVLIFAGFLTPIAASVVTVTEAVSAIYKIAYSANGGESDWIYSLFTTGAAATLTLTGPGAFSLDARIFGPKRLFIPLDNSPSVLSSAKKTPLGA